MPTHVQAALLGVLQGLTEFLPVSSTAHLIIGARLLGYDDPGGVFIVMIQLGSVLAVMWLYRAKLVAVAAGLPSSPEARRFAVMLGAATLPALVAGAMFAGYVKQVLYYSPLVIAISFIAGGVVMLAADRSVQPASIDSVDDVPLGKAGGIGVCQTLALVPGVSRSGATMVGGLALGLSRPAAAEFSFFLAMPTMCAAFAHDFLEARSYLSAGRGGEIAIGFVAAFLTALVVVRPFVAILRRSGFAPFAWYRIAAGLALIVAMYSGWR
ncbi:MAG: undecaprenyl-diphosphate phosphatase [Acidobacteria bacterium]|nr:undecaprenyl-diphosphate phosphatase [Acidobacteriota bacterium]